MCICFIYTNTISSGTSIYLIVSRCYLSLLSRHILTIFISYLFDHLLTQSYTKLTVFLLLYYSLSLQPLLIKPSHYKERSLHLYHLGLLLSLSLSSQMKLKGWEELIFLMMSRCIGSNKKPNHTSKGRLRNGMYMYMYQDMYSMNQKHVTMY